MAKASGGIGLAMFLVKMDVPQLAISTSLTKLRIVKLAVENLLCNGKQVNESY